MSTATAQLALSLSPRPRGGRRPGAGRPRRGARASERHKRRPRQDARHPLHVICRVEPAVGRLRKRKVYKVAQRALVTCWKRSQSFRICHISIQGTHLHLIVEADTAHDLARGMQGFQVSFARRINAIVGRKGRVFSDRYHAVILDSPTKVRNAMAYVLNNWRRHGEDRGVFATRHDVYSSGLQSNIWHDAAPLLWLRPGQQLLPVCYPRTWLLGHGWRQVGPISPWVRPGRNTRRTTRSPGTARRA